MNPSELSEHVAATLLQAGEYRELSGRAAKEPTGRRYVITISREAGAQGTSVARAVGKRLSWQVYDGELLDRVAKEMGSEVNVLHLIDEKPVSWLLECIQSLAAQYHLSQDSYMVHLIATVRSLAQQGNCVIVGRGANFMLPHDTSLNVRLVAGHKDRVATLQRLRQVPEKEAARLEEQIGRERFDFVKRRFGKDVNDPHFYDLVLNTSHLSVDDCAEVIVAALRRLEARKHSAKLEPAMTYHSDE